MSKGSKFLLVVVAIVGLSGALTVIWRGGRLARLYAEAAGLTDPDDLDRTDRRDTAAIELARDPNGDAFVYALLERAIPTIRDADPLRLPGIDDTRVAYVLMNTRADASPQVLWAVSGWLDVDRDAPMSSEQQMWTPPFGIIVTDGGSGPLKELAHAALLRALKQDCMYDRTCWRKLLLDENEARRWQRKK